MLLPENYVAPAQGGGSYTRLLDGETRIRILSQAIVGWEDWLDKKPVRYRMNEKPKVSFDPKKPIKHFWAFIVYNHTVNQIQIMQITQATIRSSLEALSKDQDWGSPYFYDIKITRTGEGVDSKYTVNPSPHKPVSEEILKEFKDKPINLEALFDGADPFSKDHETFTPLLIDIKKTGDNKISEQKFIELSELLLGCSEKTQSGFKDVLKKNYNISLLSDLLVKDYDKVKSQILFRYKENQAAALDAEMKNKG